MMAYEVASEAGWSQVSESDRIMFSVLGNPDRLNMAALPRISEDMSGRIQEVEHHEHNAHDSGAGVGLHLKDVPEEMLGEVRPELPPDALPDVRAEVPPERPAEVQPELPPEVRPELPPEASQEVRPELPPEVRPEMPSERRIPDDAPEQVDSERQRMRDDEKRTVLLDLQRMETQQGVRLTKEWSMNDSLEDMTLELRKIVLNQDERSNINMMRDGLRMMVTGIEMVSNRFGILDLEGWSSEVCQDLSRHDASLGRIYRKYWRRSTSNSPETDIAFAVLGSAGLHHMKRTMAKQMLRNTRRPTAPSRPSSRRTVPNPDSSDEEAPP